MTIGIVVTTINNFFIIQNIMQSQNYYENNNI